MQINDFHTIHLLLRKCICSEAYSNHIFQQNREKCSIRTVIYNIYRSSRTVAYAKSIACSTSYALEWDPSFKNNTDESGRAVLGIHKSEVEITHANKIYTSPSSKPNLQEKDVKNDEIKI